MNPFSDQCTTSRKKHHKSRRWYLSGVFLQSFDWIAHNSYVLWCDFNTSTALQNRGVKRLLADNLMAFGNALVGITPSVAPTPTPAENIMLPFDRSIIPPKLDRRLVAQWRLDPHLQHFAAFTDKRRDCVGHKQRKRVHSYCSVCCVYLCEEDGCFIRFHTLKDYLYDDPTLAQNNRRVRQQYVVDQ